MNNKYEHLLEDISKLKNVGKKTSLLLKKKILIIFSIFCGDFHSLTLIDRTFQK